MKKFYYSIGEVSNLIGVKSYVLRYWETEFPTLKPRKNSGGNRKYSADDIDVLRDIKYMLYEQKFTIEGARKKLAAKKNKKNEPQMEIDFPTEQKNRVNKIKESLLDLKAGLLSRV